MMFGDTGLISWFLFKSTTPDVAVAQLRQLRRQVPLLYALLMVNAWAVAYTHYRFAPRVLTLGVTSALSAVCVIRIAGWLLPNRGGGHGAGYAIGQLRRTTVMAGAQSAVFVFWSLALDQYGGPLEHGHVALFIAITVIGCIFCLMHLPQAALLVTFVVTGPYLIYYFLRDDPVFIAIAINIALVTAVMVQVLLNSFGGFTRLVQSQADLALKQIEAKRLSDENARIAHTDSLTGLPNRRYFFAKLEELIRDKAERQERFVVGVLDLDRFKPLNDAYGHAFGDRLLAEIGRRLHELTSEHVIVARLGGDEFGLLLTQGADDALAIGQNFCDAVAQPLGFDEGRITLGCSCGLAIFPEAGSSAHELFDRSDYALYHVKSERRGGSALFSLEHETRIRSDRAIESALQAADLAVEMDVHYQPILDTMTMKVVSVEALARWTSPSLGRVPPDQFIPIAERMGLIHAISLTLFEKAIASAELLPDEVGLSFNLSANDVASPDTIRALIAQIEASPIYPSRITFELTETALMRDFELAVTAIRSLRALGAKIALDDFGTGYSSLGYLRQLPIDRIKVDKSFVADLEDVSGRNIVTAIFGLCKNLSLDCIIEGVESDEQLHRVRDLGYRMVQGYLFARPMAIAPLLTWLTARDLQQHVIYGKSPQSRRNALRARFGFNQA